MKPSHREPAVGYLTKGGVRMFEKVVLTLAVVLSVPTAGMEGQERPPERHLFGGQALLRGSGETNVYIGGHLLLPLNHWLDLYPSIGVELQHSLARVDLSAMARFRPFRRGILAPFYGAAGVGTVKDHSSTRVVDRLVIGGEWRMGRWAGFLEWESMEWFASRGFPVPRTIGFLVGVRQRWQ